MAVGVSVISDQAGKAAASSSFSVGEAVLIFVLVIAALVVLVAVVGRRTRQLAFRPRVRTAHNRRIRQAAQQDVDAIGQADRGGPEAPGNTP